MKFDIEVLVKVFYRYVSCIYLDVLSWFLDWYWLDTK